MSRRSDSDRWPAAVFAVGTEPDPRFSLANERTFLAWIRTGLAFVAAAAALSMVDLDISRATQTIGTVALSSIGVMCGARAWSGWLKSERALRLGRPLPGPGLGLALAGLLALMSVSIGVLAGMALA